MFTIGIRFRAETNWDYVQCLNISSLSEEPRSDSLRVRPYSFVQALLNYCMTLPDVQAQLRRVLQPVLGFTGDMIFDW